jgi:hypothetical protein
MGKILGGRCQCGYTCSGLIFGVGENNHNFDIAICYQCKELYSVELPVSSLGKESASVADKWALLLPWFLIIVRIQVIAQRSQSLKHCLPNFQIHSKNLNLLAIALNVANTAFIFILKAAGIDQKYLN